MQGLLQIVRWISYAALLVVITAFGALIILSLIGVCSSLNEGGIACATPLYTLIAQYAIGVMLATVFTGIPALFAMLGVYFLVRDIYDRLRDGKARPPSDMSMPARAEAAERAAPTAKAGPLPLPRLILRLFLVLVALGVFAALISGIVAPLG